MKQKLNNGMGARLRKAREDIGLSREAFAEQIDISPTYLAEVEAGKKSLSTVAVCKACEKASISADYLLLGKEQKADCSAIIEMLSNLDQKYVGLAEDMLKSFVLAVGRSKSED